MQDLTDLFQNGKWYHLLRFEGMVSNGTYDIESYLPYYHFENNYQGKTVLDVGCSDGYFSLLMKEMGAERVCAIDSNKYDGALAIQASNFKIDSFEKKYQGYLEDYLKFRTVYESYGLETSNKLLLMAKLKKLEIEYHTGTIYDLKPYGTFDIVLCNDLLEHLRDPITAIEQLFFATKEKCIFTVSSAMKNSWFNRNKPLLAYQGHFSGGSFYSISEPAFIALCQAAGFKEVKIISRFKMENKRNQSKSYRFVAHAYK